MLSKFLKESDKATQYFTAAMEDVSRSLDWHSYGMNVDGERLTHLRFADILLVSHDPLELRELNNESKNAGLNLNVKKTKVMMNSKHQHITLTVDGKMIEKVDNYAYLCKNISL